MRREYLSPDQAAELLGWKDDRRGERLIRAIRSKEARINREIMIRLGGERRGIRYKFTEALLRRHCPEFFLPSTDALVTEVRIQLAAIESKIEATIDERMAPQLESLKAADARIALELGKLAGHTRENADTTRALERRVLAIESTQESGRERRKARNG